MSFERFRFHMLQPLKSAPGLEFEQNLVLDWFNDEKHLSRVVNGPTSAWELRGDRPSRIKNILKSCNSWKKSRISQKGL